MKRVKQLSLTETGFLPKAGKKTRKAVFLVEVEVTWSRLKALTEPFYPNKGNGRPPMLLGTMLRIHFMQQWFGYSDPAMEEALHDVPLASPHLCGFLGGRITTASVTHLLAVKALRLALLSLLFRLPQYDKQDLKQ